MSATIGGPASELRQDLAFVEIEEAGLIGSDLVDVDAVLTRVDEPADRRAVPFPQATLSATISGVTTDAACWK